MIAMKFKPELRVRERRGPNARRYYSLAVKKFRDDTQILATTVRYKKLFAHLNQSKNFREVWQEATNSPEYKPVARFMTHPDTYLSNGTMIRSTVYISEIKYGSGISQYFHTWSPDEDYLNDYLKVREQAKIQYSKSYYRITDYIDPDKLAEVGAM